jgi:YbbR domain-containing protein
MNLNFENPWITRIVSVALAAVLFLFVNIENQSRFLSNEPNDGASVMGSEIVTNVPIQINVDTDRYFVSGIPDAASIRIEGPQAILFQTVATQNFSIETPNLNELDEGTHIVQLTAEGLSNDLSYSISPSAVNLTIEEKQVEEYELSVIFDEDLDIAENYEVGEPELGTNVVQLSGAASTMQQISQVAVEITSNEMNINSDITVSAQVLVLDESGSPLNVNATPSQVEVRVPVRQTQREVPIVLREGENKVPGYTYEIALSNSEPESILISGDPDIITEISNFPVTVDFNGITESSLVTIPITDLPEGVEETSREEIEVLIEVTEINNNGNTRDE